MAVTPDDKLQWEIRKLQAETENLARPFLRQPAFWVGIGTLLLSLGTNLLQVNKAERDRQLALIAKEKIELETQKLTVQRADLEASIRTQTAQLDEVAFELQRQQDALAKLKAELGASGAAKEAVLHDLGTLQARAASLQGTVAQASRDVAQSAPSVATTRARDFARAEAFELQAYQALASGDLARAQTLFQASEDAANSYHFSYEWSRLLRRQRAALATPEGRRQVLREAIGQDFLRYAPADLRARIEAQAN